MQVPRESPPRQEGAAYFGPACPNLRGSSFVRANTSLINHRPPGLSLLWRLPSKGIQEMGPSTSADRGSGSTFWEGGGEGHGVISRTWEGLWLTQPTLHA